MTDDSINRTKHAAPGRGFLRGSIVQILAWPILCLVLATVLWYWTLSKINAEKYALENKALEDASALCKDYAQYLVQVIEQANQITLQLKYDWEQSHGNLNLQQLSQSGIYRNPQIINVLAINRQGTAATSIVPSQQSVSYADMDFFLYHKSDESNALLVGKPLSGRLSSKPIMPFSRRLNTSNGAFDGVALVSFDPSYLTAFYAGSFPGKTGLLAVAGLDGTLRSAKIGNESQQPTPAALRAAPLFDSPEGASYLNGEQWFGDKQARFVAWKTLKDYPLVLMVGISEQEYFASQQKSWTYYRVLATSVSIVLFLFALAATGMSVRLARKKHQEEEVRKAYRIATEGGNEGFYMYEALRDKSDAIIDFVLVDCNERGAEFYGVAQMQLLQTKLSSFYPAPYFDELMETFRSAMVSGFYEDESKMPRESKMKIEWAKTRLVRSGNGLAVTVQDITERKRTEDELRRAYGENRVVTEAIHDNLYMVDGAGRLTWWNRQVEETTGLGPETLKGMPAPEFFVPEDRPRVEEAMRKAGTEGYAEVEAQLITPNGPVSYDYNGVPVLDAEGRFLGIAGVGRDISERKRTEQALKRLNEELEDRVEQRTVQLLTAKEESERANEAKSEFLSRMSHELRTPLNAILGFGQLLQLEIQDEEQADNVQEILHAGQHLLELINEVLDLARIESGKFTVSMEPVALRPLIAECLSLIRPQAEARGIHIAEAERDCVGSVSADRTRVKQVLLNLLSNAVKYNCAQGTVSIVCMPDGDAMQIRISDTGAGLTAEQQARLFVAFERLDADKSAVEGTGIGLALSKRLVEHMEGEIGVESTPGSGSTFWVRLPMADGHADQVHPTRPAAEEPTDCPDSYKQWVVLCIEDNPANLRLIERILGRRQDIRLLTASAPGLGLELAQAHRPALILLDINLPDMDGYAVMQCLRENEATRNIPVVAVSASAMPKDLDRGKEAGFADYLTKPLDVSQLLQVIDETLGTIASTEEAAP